MVLLSLAGLLGLLLYLWARLDDLLAGLVKRQGWS
jgi:hypothetical protein